MANDDGEEYITDTRPVSEAAKERTYASDDGTWPVNVSNTSNVGTVLSSGLKMVSDSTIGTIDSYWKYYGARYNVGAKNVRDSEKFVKAAFGKMSYEDAVNETKPTGSEELDDKYAADFKKQHNAIYDIAEWPGAFSESLPASLETLKDSLAAGAAGVGFGTGAAAIAGQAGPQAALPEELLTMPAGALYFGGIGAKAGAFHGATKIATGLLYKELRAANIPHEEARLYALSGGAISGALEAMQFGIVSNLMQKQLLKTMAGKQGQAALSAGLKGFFESSAGQLSMAVGAGALGEGVDEMSQNIHKVIAAIHTGKSILVDGTLKAPPKDFNEWKDWIIKAASESMAATVEGFKAEAISGGAAHIGSTQVGKGAALYEVGRNKTVNAVLTSMALRLNTPIDLPSLTAKAAPKVANIHQSMDDVRYQLTQAEKVHDNLKGRKEILQKVKDAVKKSGGEMPESVKNDLEHVNKELRNIKADIKLLRNKEALLDIESRVNDANVDDPTKRVLEAKAEKLRGEIASLASGVASRVLYARIMKDEAALTKQNEKIDGMVSTRMGELDDVITKKQQLKDSITDPKSLPMARALQTEIDASLDERQSLSNVRGALANMGQPGTQALADLKAMISNNQITGTDIAKTVGPNTSLSDLMIARSGDISALTNNKPLAGSIRKAMRLTEDLDLLKLTRAIVTDENLSVEELEAVAGMVPAIPTRSAARLVEDAIRAMRVVARTAKTDATNRKTLNQNMFVAYIKTSGLRQNQQGSFLTAVKNITTEKDLNEEIDKAKARIVNIIEHEARAKAQERLDNAVSEIGATTGTTKKYGKVDYDSGKALATFKLLVEDAQSKDSKGLAQYVLQTEQDRLTAEAAALAGGQMIAPSPVSIDTEIAQMVARAFENPDAGKLNQLAETIENVMDAGEKNALTRKLEEYRLRDEMTADVINWLIGNTQQSEGVLGKTIAAFKSVILKPDPVELDVEGRVKLRRDTMANKLDRLRHAFGQKGHTWDQLMELLAQDDVGMAHNTLDVHEVVQDEHNNIQSQTLTAVDHMSNALMISQGMTKDKADAAVMKLLHDRKLSERVEVGVSYNQNGNPITHVLSLDEVIQRVADFKRAKMHSGLKGAEQFDEHGESTGVIANGDLFTFRDNTKNFFQLDASETSTQELFEDYIAQDPVAQAVLEGGLQFYRDNYDRVNPQHVDEFGTDLDQEENYGGNRRRKGAEYEQGSLLDRMNNFRSRSSLTPSSVMNKTESSKAYQEAGFTSNMFKYIADTESWMAWRKMEPRLRAVFANQIVRDAINEKFGKDAIGIIDHQYSTMAGTRGEQLATRVDMLDLYRVNVGPAALAFNPLTAAKQLSGVFLFAGADHRVAPGAFTKYLMKALDDPRAAVDKLRGTRYMIGRAENILLEMNEANKKGGLIGRTGAPWLVKKGLGMLQQNDRVAHFLGGYALYESVKETVLRETGDEQLAEREGLAAFERTGNRTQSSGTPDQKAIIETGSFAKAKFLFKRTSFQRGGRMLNLTKRFYANPNKANYEAMQRAYVAGALAQATFVGIGGTVAAVAGSKADKDKVLAKMMRESGLFPLLDLPMFGDFFGGASMHGTNVLLEKRAGNRGDSKSDAVETVFPVTDLPSDLGNKAVELSKYGLDVLKGDKLTRKEALDAAEDASTTIGGATGTSIITTPALRAARTHMNMTKDDDEDDDE